MPLAVANLAFYWGWESAFYFVGTVTGITAVLLWLLIKDSPSLSINSSSPITNLANRRVKNHSCTQVVFNPDVWMLCISHIIFTVLRCCISDWSQLYFIEAADLTEAESKTKSRPNLVLWKIWHNREVRYKKICSYYFNAALLCLLYFPMKISVDKGMKVIATV